MKILRLFLVFLWEAPQVILGSLILLVLYVCRIATEAPSFSQVNTAVIVSLKLPGAGFNLGPWVFIGQNGGIDNLYLQIGYRRMSAYYGPIYLLLVTLKALIIETAERIRLFPPGTSRCHWPYTEAQLRGHDW